MEASALDTLVQERRSIRGYQDKPVSKELIAEIIGVAKGAPSSMNTQPWFFHVVTGEPLERIREGNTAKMMSGANVDREICSLGPTVHRFGVQALPSMCHHCIHRSKRLVKGTPTIMADP